MFTFSFSRSWVLSAGIALLANIGVVRTSQAADDFMTALTGGKVLLNVRYRYELVDQNGISTKSHASTVRTRLGYVTDEYRGFSALLEMENTTDAFDDDYTVPAASPHGPKEAGEAVIADPIFTEVNQAWLQYVIPNVASLRYGRERVILDNARFIGNVGWRQNEQTFDAFTVRSDVITDTTLFYSYFSNANTVIGADRDMRSHIINATYSGFAVGKLTAYGYLLDFDGDDDGTDTATVGVRFKGDYDVNEGLTLLYTAEFANQSDYEDSDNIDENYYRLVAGGTVKKITGKIGYEVLEGDGTVAFQTPLATLHAMNGWADKFLTTPVSGLEDLFVSIGGTVRGIKLLGVYHDFSANDGGADYGTEIDLLAAYKYNKNFSTGVKYANYDADDLATDTKKYWLWGQLSF